MKLPRKKKVDEPNVVEPSLLVPIEKPMEETPVVTEESIVEDTVIEEPIVESVVEEKAEVEEKPTDKVMVKVLAGRLHCEFGTFKRNQVFECPLKQAREMIPYVKILR